MLVWGGGIGKRANSQTGTTAIEANTLGRGEKRLSFFVKKRDHEQRLQRNLIHHKVQIHGPRAQMGELIMREEHCSVLIL